MRKFTDHWYAPRHAATHDLLTGRSVAGEATCRMRRNDGSTSGFAAVQPYPLDYRGCFVHLILGDLLTLVTICLGDDLTDYYQGTAQEIADFLEKQAAEARPEQHVFTRRPFVGQSDQEWLEEGRRLMEEWQAKVRERAALIAALSPRA